MVELDKKPCAMCYEYKPISEFKVKKKIKKGKIYNFYDSYCTHCSKLYNKEYKRIWRERRKAEGKPV